MVSSSIVRKLKSSLNSALLMGRQAENRAACAGAPHDASQLMVPVRVDAVVATPLFPNGRPPGADRQVRSSRRPLTA